MLSRIIVPSIPYLNYALFKFLSNHPLLIAPLVLHPLTEVPIPISVYRFQDGFPVGLAKNTVACCIIPGAAPETSGHLPSPSSISASVLYKPYDIGNNHDEAIYHFGIKFYYQEVVIPGKPSTDPDLINVPADAMVHPSQRLLLTDNTKTVKVEVNPGIDIIGDYLELARLALCDKQHFQDFPINVSSIDIIHQNAPSTKWDAGTNSFLHNGHILVRACAYVSRGWRDKFLVPLEKVNLDIDAELEGFDPYQEIFVDRTLDVSTNKIDYIPLSEKAAPFGVATLDENKKVRIEQLPAQGLGVTALELQNVIATRASNTDLANLQQEVNSLNSLLAGGTFLLPYNHVQNILSQTWVINHGLGRYPSITTWNSLDQQIEGDIINNSVNTSVVSFGTAISGRAYCV